MNWQKALLSGLAAGIALSIYEFIMHGLIMANTYIKYPELYDQQQANPLYFLLIAVCITTFSAILLGKTRQCWADGFKGGATYGFFLGMIFFFVRFYDAIIYDGFPYYLAWCQGSINLIGTVIAGGVMGLIYKRG